MSRLARPARSRVLQTLHFLTHFPKCKPSRLFSSHRNRRSGASRPHALDSVAGGYRRALSSAQICFIAAKTRNHRCSYPQNAGRRLTGAMTVSAWLCRAAEPSRGNETFCTYARSIRPPLHHHHAHRSKDIQIRPTWTRRRQVCALHFRLDRQDESIFQTQAPS